MWRQYRRNVSAGKVFFVLGKTEKEREREKGWRSLDERKLYKNNLNQPSLLIKPFLLRPFFIYSLLTFCYFQILPIFSISSPPSPPSSLPPLFRPRLKTNLLCSFTVFQPNHPFLPMYAHVAFSSSFLLFYFQYLMTFSWLFWLSVVFCLLSFYFIALLKRCAGWFLRLVSFLPTVWFVIKGTIFWFLNSSESEKSKSFSIKQNSQLLWIKNFI